jgi:hypothetical protein
LRCGLRQDLGADSIGKQEHQIAAAPFTRASHIEANVALQLKPVDLVQAVI